MSVYENPTPEMHRALGSLSMALALVVKHKDPFYARKPLEEFMAAPVASPELRRMLRQEVGK